VVVIAMIGPIVGKMTEKSMKNLYTHKTPRYAAENTCSFLCGD